jgi:hypothetical protein
MSESVNLILNFGAEPLFGVLSQSQMIRDVGRALMQFDRTTLTTRLPDALEQIKSTDATFENVISSDC